MDENRRNEENAVVESSEKIRKDEELFTSLSKKKKRKRRRIVFTVILIVLVLAVGLSYTVTRLRKKVDTKFNEDKDEVISAQVKTGSISTTVSGSGTLTNVDIKQLHIPKGVDVDDVLVSVNDTVEEGEIIATVDSRTVLAAMSDVQAELVELDKKLNDAGSDYVNDYISTGIPGRVKKINAAVGDDVASVMYKYGALAELSLDGYMAVDIEPGSLAKGTQVKVLREDGSEIKGLVNDLYAGKAIVVVSDDGPVLNETVTVMSVDGDKLGEGELYINSPLRITGVAGTIQSCYVAENQKLYSSGLLFTLTNTEYYNDYYSLLKDREELEDTLQELLALNMNGGLAAPYSGTICSVEYEVKDEDEVVTTTTTTTTSGAASYYSAFFGGSDTASDMTTVTSSSDKDENIKICTICPDLTMEITLDVDESDILTLELGQKAEVTISSISSDETFEGTVTEISRSATTSSSGVTKYSAVVSIDKTEKMLSGMSAEVYVSIQGKDNALIIPVDALHQTSSTSFVYTSYDKENKEYGGRVEVTTGLSNSSFVEISSGLKEGDTVYYVEKETFKFPNFSSFGNMGGMTGGMGGRPGGGYSGRPGGGMPGRG